MTRILVAIVTYVRDRYALVPVLQGLQKQRFQDFDVLVIDNSRTGGYDALLRQALEAAFPDKETKVIHVDSGSGRFERIRDCRNRAREEFLASDDHTHLFFLDSDILLPRNALARLLEAETDLTSGVYLNAFEIEGKKELRPCLYIDQGEGKARIARISEVLKNDMLEIGAAGMGCTLASRNAVETTEFRLNPSGTGEDIMFYRDVAERLETRPVAITDVKCLHMHWPFGDQRNKMYDLSRYKLQDK